MPLNPTPVGDAIAALIQASAPTPGTPVTEDQLKTLWEGIIGIIYTDLKTNLQIEPGSFVVPSGPSAGPISGIGGPAL